jgi:zinc protease
MTGVILNAKELTPEQGNVLSEFDMYNGDPHFALAVQMVSTAFHSHPYGHETIGYREDIEDYTPARLERFYRNYYRPDNAVMMVIGDIDEKPALAKVKAAFSSIENPSTTIPRHFVREPKQEGLRRVTIERSSSTNILSLGFKHTGFGTPQWLTTMVLIKALTAGPESILEKKLVDTGLVSSIDTTQEPTKDVNLALLNFTLAPKQNHQVIEEKILAILSNLTPTDVAQLLKKVKAGLITDELFARSNSLQITQELTEYVASGDWTAYAKTPKLLEVITPKMVIDTLKEQIVPKNMTIGYFIGN